jgi:tRNA 2-thiouridine synthesizing protein A
MNRTLDVTGLICPLPVLRARKALKDVAVGDCLTVLATDPASGIDFRHFCDSSGHQLVDASEADGVFTFVIRCAA